MDYKQAIIVRADLGMGKRKMVAQGSHASLMAYKKADAGEAQEWEEGGSKKLRDDSLETYHGEKSKFPLLRTSLI